MCAIVVVGQTQSNHILSKSLSAQGKALVDLRL